MKPPEQARFMAMLLTKNRTAMLRRLDYKRTSKFSRTRARDTHGRLSLKVDSEARTGYICLLNVPKIRTERSRSACASLNCHGPCKARLAGACIERTRQVVITYAELMRRDSRLACVRERAQPRVPPKESLPISSRSALGETECMLQVLRL